MSSDIKSILLGLIFSFIHVMSVAAALRYFRKIAPVLIHALSACSVLIALCVVSKIALMNMWIAFSVLAFTSSAFLFIFGTVYKSLMIRILGYLHDVNDPVSVEQINDMLITPTFTQRCKLLVKMGQVCIADGYYSLTQKGQKTAKIIATIRKIFNVHSVAMYGFKSKKMLWKKKNSFQSNSKILVIVVYTLLIALFSSGLYQKIYKSADNRIKFHAVPIAISTLYQGHKHDYRGWLSTERPFQKTPTGLQDQVIKEQIEASVDHDMGHYYWVADDRGYVDYVIAAFALFGPRLKSLYFFWFFILFVSIFLFVISFHRYPWAMAYLAFVILGLHSAMSLVKLAHVDEPIFDPRYLEVLALVSVIHMIFTSVFVAPKDLFKHAGPLLGQIAIFVFLYHARSSLGWEILAVVLISFGCALVRKKWNRIKVPLGVSALLLVGSTAFLSGYKHLTYHPNYFKEMGVRTFWHNALMGMQIEAMPANLVSDHTAAGLVLEYANQSGCTSKLKDLSVQDLLNSLGCWGTADWKEYEYWAKKLYLSLLWEYKLDFLKLYLIQKPWQVINDTFYPKQILFSEKRQTLKRTMPWSPFHFTYIIPFLIIALSTGKAFYTYRRKLLFISSFIFLCGLIPPVAFYSDIVTHGGISVMKVVLLYLAIIISLTCTYDFTKKLYYKLSAKEKIKRYKALS